MKHSSKSKGYDRDSNGTPINRAKTWGKKSRCPKLSRKETKLQIKKETI